MRFCSLLFLVIALAANVSAATYRIAPSGGDYTTMAGLLAAHTIVGDDIIIFQAASAGGTATWNEDWTLNGSGGTVGHPVTLTIRAGDTIKNQRNFADHVMDLSGKNYVTVDGFSELSQCKIAVIYGNGGTGWVIQNCTITNTISGCPTTGISQDKTCITLINCTSPSILTNHCSTDTAAMDQSIAQTDVLYINGTSPLIRANFLRNANNVSSNSDHNDGLQLENSSNATIEQNVVDMSGKSTVNTQGQGIYVEQYNTTSDVAPTDYGTTIIRNNLIFGYGGSYLLITEQRALPPQTKGAKSNWQIYGNTVDAWDMPSSVPFRMSYDDTWNTGQSADVRDNMFLSRRTAALAVVSVIDPPFTTLTIDYNFYYAPNENGSSQIYGIGGALDTTAQWLALGYDAHSKVYNSGWTVPTFNNYAAQDYRPVSNSPQLGIGVAIGSLTTDANGVTRPNPPSMGAYELASIGGGASFSRSISGTRIRSGTHISR